jgi:hypothetical protein
VHHSQVEIGFRVWIRLLKNPNEIIANFSQFEEFFDLVFFGHGELDLELQQFENRLSFDLGEIIWQFLS